MEAEEAAKNEEIEPKVEAIAFSGKLTGSFEDIASKLATLPFLSVKQQKDELIIARVESRNIHKRPFLFYIVSIRDSGMTVTYSIAPDTSERIRRLTIIKNMASILSIIAGQFLIDQVKFFQYVDSAIDDAINGLSQDYSVLFNRYDYLLAEYREQRRLNSELSVANRNLTLQATQLSEENKKLRAELDKLQIYSDEALMSIVQGWIETHNSSIDLDEFSQAYKVSIPRVEQILDKMVSLGYLELKG
ncbi:MAG: hypothetical protein ACP5MK_00365 [Candidatus Micrarchaeia archaeon]